MTHKPNRETITIPVEIQNREMLAKLYLGAMAASRGFDVVVGDQKEIAKRFFDLQPGIYLDKSVAKTKRVLFRKLRRLGYAPVVMCEEGLVYRDTERYIKERIDPETLEQTYGFYCWGQKQETDVEAGLSGNDKLLVTGNPRIDLLRPEFRQIWNDKCAQISKDVGKFILINTNFSRYNRLPGTADVIKLLKKRGTLDLTDGPKYYAGLVQHLSTIMSAFLDVIPKIVDKFPNHTIVIRPHPGENVGPYRTLAARYNNVRIINSGHVVPWLISADVVVHNSCTTGVEAWILDRPGISYMPVRNPSYDSKLPNDLSFKCFDPIELVNKIETVVTQKSGAKRDSHTIKLAEYYISGLAGRMAADLLLDHLPKVQVRSSRILVAKERFLALSKNNLRKVPGLSLSAGLVELGKQKFPGIEEDEVQKFLSVMGLCRPEICNVQVLKMEKFRNVFYLSAKK